MDHETLQALIEVFRSHCSSDLLSIILDEAEGPQTQAAVLDLLRSLSEETFADDKLAPARRKACQFSLKAGDFELAERLARASDQPEDKALRARALHGLGQEAEAIALYREATSEDPAMRNRDLERLLGIRPGPSLVATPAKIISLTHYSSSRRAEAERREGGTADPLMEELGDGAVTFADVAGLDDIKAEIRARIVLPYLKPSLYEKFKQEAGGSLLIYGPPGCGKTLIARATAGESDARFLAVTGEDIADKFPGESEKRLRVFFDEARSDPPAVLFFDDFDIIGRHRQLRSSAGLPLLTSVFLSELDAIGRSSRGVLVIAATNAPFDVDPAYFRAGRFQRLLYAAPPDSAARRAILSRAFKDVPGADDIAIDRIVSKTEGFSGADLKALAERACMDALMRTLAGAQDAALLTTGVEIALKFFAPSTKEWLAETKVKLRTHPRDESYARIFAAVHAR